MERITYLFGAGASFNALPIVCDIPNRIEQFIIQLESQEFELDNTSSFDDLPLENPKSRRHYQLDLIISLKWLIDECKNHKSIDELALELYNNFEYKKLIKLKVTLSIFFVFEQAMNKHDYRYEEFFDYINNYKHAENVKIISWNYDYQIELANLKYGYTNDIHHLQQYLGVVEKYCGIGYNDVSLKNIFKINGTVSLHSNNGLDKYFYNRKINGPIDIAFINKLIWSYAAVMDLNERTPSLSFSWEKDNDNIIEQAIESTKDTDVLVIIGYSFPQINRDVDRRIIGKMTNLKRIIFQAPNADEVNHQFRMMNLDLNNIESHNQFDTKHFLLPIDIKNGCH